MHDDWVGRLVLQAEKAAKAQGPSKKTLPELLDEIRADRKLSTAALWTDVGNKVRDGVLARAPNEAVKYVSQWTVEEDNLERKTVEMINSAIYYTAGAQNPPKQASKPNLCVVQDDPCPTSFVPDLTTI